MTYPEGYLNNHVSRYQPKVRYWTHKRVSFFKSAIRLMACGIALIVSTPSAAVVSLAVGFAVAEWLGVWEELGE